MIKPKEGSWGPLIYSHSARGMGDDLDLRLVFAVEAVLGSEPLNCGIGCCLQLGSVRIEYNLRTSSWCWRIRKLLGVGKKNLSTFPDQN